MDPKKTIQIDEELHAELVRLKEEEGVTITAFTEIAIRKELERRRKREDETNPPRRNG